MARISLAVPALVLTFSCNPVPGDRLSGRSADVEDPSPAAEDHFGRGLAVVSDLDGDGIHDVAAGAPGADRVHVLSGADGTVIRTVADPDGLTGYEFGQTVAAVGDWNGDGKEEFAVGAPGVEGILPLPCMDPCTPPPDWGRAFVFSGGDGSLVRRFVPPEASLLFGFALASPGDLNGDGQRDLVVGAPIHLHSWGTVHALSGATGALLWEASEPGAGSDPRQPIASFGNAVAPVADLNGDGSRDLLVGAPYFDDGSGALAGKVFLLSGASGAELRTHVTPAPAVENRFGFSVVSLGDRDGDGKDEYAVGDVQAARVHVYRGSDGAALGTIAPLAAGSLFGVSLAAAADHDGDGASDIWVSALVPPSVRLFGASGAEIRQETDPTPDGTPVEHAFGRTIAAVAAAPGSGDLDLAVGEPGETVAGHAGAGAVFLFRANREPVADAGPDQLVECDRLGTVTLDGSASSDPDGDPLTFGWAQVSGAPVALATSGAVATFSAAPPGSYGFQLTVADGAGGSDSDAIEVVVRDTAPPSLAAALDPSVLWPPDHRLVTVSAALDVADACDGAPSVRLASIASDEPDDGRGDGDTSPDVLGAELGTDDRSFMLRAERSGRGDGRTYTVTYEVEDGSGNVTAASEVVSVPKSRHGR